MPVDVETVRERVDLVELVGETVELQRSGASFKARCPFHAERTPSFYVFPERQSWRCFGACAEGGDVFAYWMKREGAGFAEALRALAERAGVTVAEPRRNGGGLGRAAPSERPKPPPDAEIRAVNEAAAAFYRQTLHDPRAAFALAYLTEKRGIGADCAAEFELGYAPVGGELLREHLAGLGWSDRLMLAAGLTRNYARDENDRPRIRDLFRGRLLMPIRDRRGRLVGFGGRALRPGDRVKYLNTPATGVFDKSRVLYGLDKAAAPARREGLVIVEGYLDAVRAHQAGFRNTVAAMGTSLTARQAKLARDATDRIALALDGDPAGQQAMLRSLEAAWEVFQLARPSARDLVRQSQTPDVDLRIAALPAGMDPDDIIARDPDEWARLTQNAVDLFDYLLTAMRGLHDVTLDRGRMAAARVMLRFAARERDKMRQSLMLSRLAQELELDPSVLHRELPTLQELPDLSERPAAAAAGRNGRRPGATPPPPDRESLYLALALQRSHILLDPECVAAPEWFASPELRAIYEALRSAGDGGVFAADLPPDRAERAAALADAALLAPYQDVRPDLMGRQICRAMELECLQREWSALTRAAGAGEVDSELLTERCRAVQERMRELHEAGRPGGNGSADGKSRARHATTTPH